MVVHGISGPKTWVRFPVCSFFILPLFFNQNIHFLPQNADQAEKREEEEWIGEGGEDGGKRGSRKQKIKR